MINRTTRQLCQDVARTVQSLLGCESRDDVLRNLVVREVQPWPDDSQLLVIVGPAENSTPIDTSTATDRLETIQRSAHLRATARRCPTPRLLFYVLPRITMPADEPCVAAER